MKLNLLIVLILLLSGCGEESGSEHEAEVKRGGENMPCYQDNTCVTGLTCSRDSICIKESLDLCQNKNCGEHSSCDQNDGRCICDTGYYKNGTDCVEEISIQKTLFISEYLEGSNFNKAIELYNPTDEAINLLEYSVTRAINGGGWESPIALSGTLESNQTFIICHNSSDDLIHSKCDLKDNMTGKFTGDDALGIWHYGVLIDVIGFPDSDPGDGWSVAGVSNGTKDHTLIRKMTITSGNTDWSSSAGTNEDNSEWVVKEQDDSRSIGVRGVFEKK